MAEDSKEGRLSALRAWWRGSKAAAPVAEAASSKEVGVEGGGAPRASPQPPQSDVSEQSVEETLKAAIAGEDAKPTVDCSEHWRMLRDCMSTGTAFRSYYIYGEIKHCRNEMYDVRVCVGARFKEAEEAMRIIEQNRQEREARRAGHFPVWKMRDKPPEGFLQ